MNSTKLGHFQIRHCRSVKLTGGEFLLAAFSWHLRKYLTNYYFTTVFEGVELRTFNRISTSCRALELQFNPHHVLECCQKLEEAREYQSDVLLVQLVRLQEIRYRMSRSFPYDDSHASRKPDAPVDMFVRAWQSELETFWTSLPIESQQNCNSTVYMP